MCIQHILQQFSSTEIHKDDAMKLHAAAQLIQPSYEFSTKKAWQQNFKNHKKNMPFTLGIPAILLIGWTANKKNNSWSHSHISHNSMYINTVQTIKVILLKKE